MGRSAHVARLVTAVAVTGVASASVAGPGVAEAQKLPSTAKTKAVPGGSVTIKLTDQKFTVSRAVTGVGTSREVLVSGKVRVSTGGDVKGGTVTAGYQVGCQVNFGGSQGGAGASGAVGGGSPAAAAGPSASFALGPGQAVFVPVIKANVGGEAVNSFTFTGHKGGVAYSQERFGVDGCLGFAEAGALVNVQVSGQDSKANVTLYGKPFSLG